MTVHELFALLTPSENEAVLSWLHENDRAAYKTCVGMLANRRKLRPIFVERKPREERHGWMKEALSKPANNDLAQEILQAWVLGANGAMVCEFLDLLGIAHDGKGLVEEIPAQPPAESVTKAVDTIAAKYSEAAVFVYLQILVGTGMTEWPTLAELTTSDPRLCRNPS